MKKFNNKILNRILLTAVLLILFCSFAFSYPDKDIIKIEQLRIVEDNVLNSNYAEVFISLNHVNHFDLRNIMITTSIPELNVVRRTTMNLRDRDSRSKSFFIELPQDIPKGEYFVRFLISTPNSRRVKYRPLIVN